MDVNEPAAVNVDAKMRSSSPSWVAYVALAGMLFQYASGGNAWLASYRDEAGKRVETATKVEARIAELARDLSNETGNLRTDLAALKVGLDQRFAEERLAREQVDKSSEFRRSTVTEKLDDAVKLLASRIDALSGALSSIRRDVQDVTEKTATLKGLLMRRGDLQSAPSQVIPDGARDMSGRSLRIEQARDLTGRLAGGGR